MKILLIGEYSRLHNSLKEGLQELGHRVTLVGTGDAFKNFDVDYNYQAKWTERPFFKYLNKIFSKLFGYNIYSLERGIRFYFMLNQLKNYDVVQLINETPIQTFAWLEKQILKKLIHQNKKTFLLSCGVDYVSVSFMNNGGFKYSLLDPYHSNPSLKSEYDYIYKYLKKPFAELSVFLYAHVNGVIASDFDYVLPLEGNPKFLGLIPNPINTDKIQPIDFEIKDKIIFFLGINRFTYIKKGIPFFEQALEVIKQKYPNRVEVVIAENLPYAEYINSYNRCHILLDQIYSYDQGYNALEAMAKGKIVFTGAEEEFLKYYGLNEDEIVINALPNTEYLIEKMAYLIENPEKLKEISENALRFVKNEHNYTRIAQKYISIWSNN